MLGLFWAVVERVKAVLAVRAAREIEADAIAHAAHRKAELLELAARYEAQGQGEVAGELRAAVGAVDAARVRAGRGRAAGGEVRPAGRSHPTRRPEPPARATARGRGDRSALRRWPGGAGVALTRGSDVVRLWRTRRSFGSPHRSPARPARAGERWGLPDARAVGFVTPPPASNCWAVRLASVRRTA